MIKILLVDDHKLLTEGLRTLIEQRLGMKVVAIAENGRTALRMVQELLPDIVIMDITMPDLNGIEATKKIIAKSLGTKIIALSIHSEKQFVQEMFKAGASGYLLKDCAFEEIVNAIRSVMKNQVYMGTGIQSIVVKDYISQIPQTTSAFSLLTVRERETLQLLAEGKGAKQIAHSLGVSVKTIETYRKNIMDKLNLHSIAELTKFAIREGLTSVEVKPS